MKLNIKTLGDLLYHFPRRYDDFSKIIAIANLKPEETATIQGKIIEIKNIRTWRRKMTITEALIEDQSGAVRAIWFNQPFIADTLAAGQAVSISGKISPVREPHPLKHLTNGIETSTTNKTKSSLFSNGVNIDKGLYFSNPSYEKITKNQQPLRHTGRLVPVYPETERLTSRWLRYINSLLLPSLITQTQDSLPPQIIRFQGLLSLADAIKQIHFPQTAKFAMMARRRLAFDELFLIQLFTLSQKIKWQRKDALKIPFNEALIKNFVARLPFKLTEAQRKAAWEIIHDLDKTKPMNRLLEGEVGSGKTVVAAIAALSVARAGYQAAFMAPTEILARQHYDTICKLFADLNIKIGLITGNERIMNYELRIKNQEKNKKNSAHDSPFLIRDSDIIIGTHALIQKNINFRNLALAVVDEQHRFGVEQRAALQKNIAKIKDGVAQKTPHLLTMTATPIPRTLALTLYGDLDISILDEIPGNRKKIITRLVAPEARESAYEFIRQEVKKDRQVFVVCPRIERPAAEVEPAFGKSVPADITPISLWDSRSTQGQFRQRDIKAVKQEYEKLSQKIFPDLKINMLHGKMKPAEKEKIMAEFKAGKIQILISTSVIEVGIDIPNATIMMIEGAERFGLAQLHQFRGRVGRGAHQSYCLLFTESASSQTRDRLKALVASNNGFELAQKDLELRGPGEFFGAQQWGLPDLSMASLADTELIKQARLEAAKILTTDPSLKNYPLLKDKLKKIQSEAHLE